MNHEVTIVGGGLAGSECAYQLAERGISVCIVEQKPEKRTPAQLGDGLAELVCSNSFRGEALTNAVGLLKEEMRRAGSLVLHVGELARVPAGGAFAVDREVFSRAITERLEAHPRIRIEHREVTHIPDARPVVLATGPLTSDALAGALGALVGAEHLAYYDAIAPIVSAASVDEAKVFRASRHDKGGDDAYLNCPFTREEYEAFVAALRAAEKVEPRSFEDVRYFEGCLPVEVMAERGERTLAFGPMRPVGLTDPRTGRWPYAVVQLRAEDVDRTAYNLVGFQTRMKWPEQKRVFSMIPGLEGVEILRYGSVHRNTFVEAPKVLDEDLSVRGAPGVHLAGQVAGVEGYVESAACGLLVGVGLAHALSGAGRFVDALPPRESALGSLFSHLRTPSDRYQPSNVMFSMFPPLEGAHRKLRKKDRYTLLARRALAALEPWLDAVGARSLPTSHTRLSPDAPSEAAPDAAPDASTSPAPTGME